MIKASFSGGPRERARGGPAPSPLILGKKTRKKSQKEEKLAGQAKQNWALPLGPVAQGLDPPLFLIVMRKREELWGQD